MHIRQTFKTGFGSHLLDGVVSGISSQKTASGLEYMRLVFDEVQCYDTIVTTQAYLYGEAPGLVMRDYITGIPAENHVELVSSSEEEAAAEYNRRLEDPSEEDVQPGTVWHIEASNFRLVEVKVTRTSNVNGETFVFFDEVGTNELQVVARTMERFLDEATAVQLVYERPSS